MIPRVMMREDALGFTLFGAVGFDHVVRLRREGNSFIDRINKKDISVDLSSVLPRDVSTLSLLLRWICYASSAGKRLHFSSLPPTLLEMSKVCGISDLLSE